MKNKQNTGPGSVPYIAAAHTEMCWVEEQLARTDLEPDQYRALVKYGERIRALVGPERFTTSL